MSRVDDIVAKLVGTQHIIDTMLTPAELEDVTLRRQLLDDVHQQARPCCGCDFYFEIEELNTCDECGACEDSRPLGAL